MVLFLTFEKNQRPEKSFKSSSKSGWCMGGLRTPPAVVPGWVTRLPEDKGSRWESMDRDSSLKPLHKHGRANRNSAPQCGVIFGCILSKVRWRCFGVGEAGGAPSPGGRQARLPLETQDWETGEWVVTCSVGTICFLGFPMGCTVQCWLSSRRVG